MAAKPNMLTVDDDVHVLRAVGRVASGVGEGGVAIRFVHRHPRKV